MTKETAVIIDHSLPDLVRSTRRSRSGRWLTLLSVRVVLCLTVLVTPGCGSFPLVRKPSKPPKPVEAAIFVADGAGNFQACSSTIRDVTQSEKMGYFVHTFEWSHGYGRILADQLAHQYAQAGGKVLAGQIEEFHERHPKCRVYVLGHSAGSSVVLSAMEHVKPGIVERAFLIAPSVSARYDVRPALKNVKHALHVYTSRHDWWYLGLATHVVGTQDRHWIEPASGRVGFRWTPSSPEEEALVPKLKQHPWRPADGPTGNLGGHFGGYQPEFLRRNVLPLTIHEADDAFLDNQAEEDEIQVPG